MGSARGPRIRRRRSRRQEDDRFFRDVQIPREYWKVIAFSENGELKAKAFLLTQNLNQLEALELDEFRVFQVNLSGI
ncbi:DNA/RNA non-specific endonuclease [Streptomyces sp. ISL-10]|uniref:DNA/RNA non-specific endonuclease n=1 Tax=Streptomyces sp. ISL-10 TaxID=2819172 RepID=UPI001BEAD039|nr:DNA/RNA non-specific endonuclease [Streptomyces sp. ISL-10]MBT2368848.1 DNA/RNA non-specific endonuclease [Streptomyces sp. ISL-10]